MSNKLFEQMAMLPAGLIALATAFTVTSCGSSEYKQYANDEAKQVASILRANDCLVCHAENAPPLPLEKSGKEIFEKRQKPVDRRRKLWYS